MPFSSASDVNAQIRYFDPTWVGNVDPAAHQQEVDRHARRPGALDRELEDRLPARDGQPAVAEAVWRLDRGERFAVLERTLEDEPGAIAGGVLLLVGRDLEDGRRRGSAMSP